MHYRAAINTWSGEIYTIVPQGFIFVGERSHCARKCAQKNKDKAKSHRLRSDPGGPFRALRQKVQAPGATQQLVAIVALKTVQM